MGLLDDLVKNNFGSPLGDSLQDILTGVRERNAAEKIAPVLKEFGSKFDPKNFTGENESPSPEDIQAMASTSIAKMLQMGPSVTGTKAFSDAQGQVQSLSDAILKGVAAENEKQLRRSQAAGNREGVRISQTATSPLLGQLTGQETLGAAGAESSAIEPYLRQQTEMARLEFGTKEQKQRAATALTTTIVKNLGELSTAAPKNLEEMLIKNPGDVDSIVKGILANLGVKKYDQKDASQKALYEKVRDKVTAGYSEFASGQTGAMEAEARRYGVDAGAYTEIVRSVDSQVQMGILPPEVRGQMIDQEVQKYKASQVGQTSPNPVLDNLKQIEAERDAAKKAADAAAGRDTTNTESKESSFYDTIWGATKEFVGDLKTTRQINEEKRAAGNQNK